MKRLFVLAVVWLVSACVSVQIPSGQESERTFTQETKVPYVNAYRIIAKQMRACYRVIGVLGNGYDIQADLDTANKRASVELYPVGLTGAQKSEESMFSRTVTVTESQSGAVIVTTGTTPKYVYLTHKAIQTWLNGVDSCTPQN